VTTTDTDVCACGHLTDEHQPRCTSIVAVHERQQYCGCTQFDADEDAPSGAHRG
jgi:hypothetical protein